MGTTYEYTYEYEISDPSKGARNTGGTTQRSVAHSHPGGIIAHSSRSDTIDPLANLQHDRIWSKLYDPVTTDKAQHDIEIQVCSFTKTLTQSRAKRKMFSDTPRRSQDDEKMARRQDRKIIKIEAAHGSDRQTFIVKRDYELRVRDVMEEASKTFKIPVDQVILYWKGRNICETPDVLLESLGVENNNTMRVARADEQYFLRHQQQGRYQQAATSSSGMYGQQQQQSGAAGYYGQQGGSYSSGYSGQQYGAGSVSGQQALSSSATSGGMYGQQQSSSTSYYGQQGGGSSSGEFYGGQQQYYPSQTYYSSSTGYDQNYVIAAIAHVIKIKIIIITVVAIITDRILTINNTNHYQQFNSQTTARSAASTPAVATYITSLQIGLGDRVQGLAIGRQHPITIYDLQVELQQHFNIPILEQNISFNGMPLLHLPPDTSLETIGIFSNSFISLWPKSTVTLNQQQFTPRQQASSSSYYYAGGSHPLYGDDMSSRRMYYSNSGGEMMQTGNQEDVMKLEVFHGSDRHVMILRSSNNIRIIDLMEELQNITTVPVQNQRLYYRGQELQTMKERTLRDVGLDNNSQVRLIGDPLKSRYAPIMAGNQTN
ncbi:unnamed protein product [Adineta ricciae]|uniref:Ubiquitin-like domain-containing protein n=1 Tax=Adineta ricciae TaxID=249248 RepID=A0A814CT37_ADIRI|nr:unnamed protein product [Adineta ricciae]